jgi:hypothetical protein
VRTPTLPELFDDNKSLRLLPHVQVNNQVNNRSTPDRSMITPGNKHLWHRPPLSSDATTINIAPLSVVALKFTIIIKPT